MLASQKEAPEKTKIQDDIRHWQRLGPGRSFSGHERDRLFTRLVPGQPLVDTGGISGIDLVDDGRSAVHADFDGDGDLDLLVRQIQVPKLVLFRNDGPNGGSIDVRVSGKAMGLNATVTAKIGERTFVRQVLAGTGFLSQKPLAVHVGLGSAAKADHVEIKFLSGKVLKVADVPAGSVVVAREDAAQPEVAPRPPPRVLGADRPKDDMRHLATSESMAGALTAAAAKALGGKLKRSADAKPLLVNLWAPWCRPCAKEMPALDAWAKAHPEVEVVGLSVDGSDEDVAKAGKKLGAASFPVGAFSPGAAARLNLDAALPASFWFGPDGKLVRGWLGAVDFATFRAP